MFARDRDPFRGSDDLMDDVEMEMNEEQDTSTVTKRKRPGTRTKRPTGIRGKTTSMSSRGRNKKK